MSIDYNEVQDGQLLKWEKEGTTVEGVLERYKTQNTTNGVGNVYEVQTKDELVPFFAPSLLHQKLERVPIGSVVKITYTKKGKTQTGNPLKHFDVSFAPATEANLKALGIEKFQNVDDGNNEDVTKDF